jgi:hypothetical protein
MHSMTPSAYVDTLYVCFSNLLPIQQQQQHTHTNTHTLTHATMALQPLYTYIWLSVTKYTFPKRDVCLGREQRSKYLLENESGNSTLRDACSQLTTNDTQKCYWTWRYTSGKAKDHIRSKGPLRPSPQNVPTGAVCRRGR